MKTLCTRCWPIISRLLRSPAFVPWCLAVAALLRLAWVFTIQAQPHSDFLWYYERAVSVATGQGYIWYGFPTAYFPPAYPVLLGVIFKLCGVSLLAAKLTSVCLQCGSAYLLYRVARRLFHSELTGRLSLLLFACYPNNIGYSSLLSSENLFIFLMLLGIATLLAAERRWWLLPFAGLVWGAAVFTRPQAVFIPLIFFALTAISTRNWRNVLLPFLTIHLLLVLLLLPWFARNRRVFQHPLITTTTGINLYIGNNPDANGTYVFTDRMLAALPTPNQTEYDFDIACRVAAERFIVEHPWHTAALLPLKLISLYISDFDSLYWNIDSVPKGHLLLMALLQSFHVLCQGYYLCFFVAFLAAVCSKRNRERLRARVGRFPWLGLGIILYFTAIYLVYYGTGRYHAPMMPWMLMYAAALLAAREEATNGTPINQPASATLVKTSQL